MCPCLEFLVVAFQEGDISIGGQTDGEKYPWNLLFQHARSKLWNLVQVFRYYPFFDNLAKSLNNH